MTAPATTPCVTDLACVATDMPAPTSPSNAAFDQFLRNRDPASGVRDFEAVDALARQRGLTLQSDHTMPANNRLLVWRR